MEVVRTRTATSGSATAGSTATRSTAAIGWGVGGHGAGEAAKSGGGLLLDPLVGLAGTVDFVAARSASAAGSAASGDGGADVHMVRPAVDFYAPQVVGVSRVGVAGGVAARVGIGVRVVGGVGVAVEGDSCGAPRNSCLGR